MKKTEQVRVSLRAAIKHGAFDPKAFFRSWFRDEGHAHFFLFTKNLKVTNLQIAELHALLRTHISSKESGSQVRDFQLLSVHEFNASVGSLVESFSEVGLEKAIEFVAELYTDLLQDIVCIQLYFGSCAVFVPCSMTLDLLPVCAESGYIHSCGASILNRNVTKATQTELFERLTAHLKRTGHAKARLVVYAHEDFTRHDRRFASELKDGLDDVKIHVEKYYIGKDSLVQTLKDLRSDVHLGTRLDIVEPKHYEAGKHLNDLPVIWLLVDHRPTGQLRTRSDEQYYILYEQEYRNESVFHLFDENKPAWNDHTTIPHTLAGAMINITRPWWPRSRAARFVDPFVGTGTTWLEAVEGGMDGHCVDNELLVEQMVRDNLEFFCITKDALFLLNAGVWCAAWMSPTRTVPAVNAKYLDKYKELLDRDEFFSERVTKDYDAARELFKAACPDQHKHEVTVTREILRQLQQATIIRRVLFYLALRTHRRKLAAIERESTLWTQAYRSEAMQLAEQMEELQELLARRQGEKIEVRSVAFAGGAAQQREYAVFPGKYSKSCSIPMRVFRDALENKVLEASIQCADARNCDELEANSCDLIVTDPPYGVNAEYKQHDLATLFQKVLERMIHSVRDGGQLVLALPD